MEIGSLAITLIVVISLWGGLGIGGLIFLSLDFRRHNRILEEKGFLMTRHTQDLIERGRKCTETLMEEGRQRTDALIEQGKQRTDALIRATHSDTQVLVRMILERTDRPRPPETA